MRVPEAAALASDIKQDVRAWDTEWLTLETVVDTTDGGVIVGTGPARRTIAKAEGAPMQPGNQVVVHRRSRAEVALGAVTTPGTPETAGLFTSLGIPPGEQQFAVYDDDTGRLGWFDGPVKVANWAPYKIESGDATATRFQEFLASLSATKMPGVLLPGIYGIETQVTVLSDVTLHMHGAQLRHTLPDVPGQDIAALLIAGVERVRLYGLDMDGNAAAYTGVTEHRHNLHIHNSHDVLIDTYQLHGAKGDGLAIGNTHNGVENTLPSTHVVLRNGAASGTRQGMSVWVVDGLWASDCTFAGTSGTLPGAGVDIEPNLVADICRNMHFTRCGFGSNEGSGFLVSLIAGSARTDQGGITVTQSMSQDNGRAGYELVNSRDVVLDTVYAKNNGTVGADTGDAVLFRDGTHENVTIRSLTARNNRKSAVAVLPGGGSIDGLKILDGLYAGNGINATWIPAIALGHPTVASTIAGLRIAGNDFGDPGETVQGTCVESYAAATIARGRLIDNDFTNRRAGSTAIVGAAALAMLQRDNVS